MTRREAMLAGVSTLVLAAAKQSDGVARITPPVTPRHPLRIEQLGRVRTDDYAWLKDPHWKQVWRDPASLDPKIRAYLAEENGYSAAILAPTEKLQAELVAEMRARTAPSPEPPPEIDGAWEYVTRYAPGAQHPRYLRRPRGGGPEELLLDVEARAQGHAYFSVKNATRSPDQRFFAWAEDAVGAEKFGIRVKDLATGEILPGGPESAFGDFAFSPDSQWLFWTLRDASSRPSRIYRRRVRGGADILVYEERDPAFLTEVSLSPSRAFLFVRSWNDVTSEARFIAGDRIEAAPTLIEPRREGILYDVADWRGGFVIRTNAGGAEDFRIVRATVAKPGQRDWQPYIPHRPGRFIVEMHPFDHRLCWIERIEGNPHIVVAEDDGTPREAVTFDEAAYTITVLPSDYRGDTLRLIYESPRSPRQCLDCDLATGARTTRALDAVPGYDPAAYVVKRLHATTSDGAQVPITILYAKDTRLDGSAPLLLTGYGAYGVNFDTGFTMPLLSLCDRGWVWAVAHVRGGSEKGRAWFEAARRFTKKTSFTDFIACAQTLIDTRHTAVRRIVLHGYSAGGLLVGAALNMRPDLWGGVIGQAPFVDMLNTMSDATHPLVPLTRPVWGDPLHDPKAYDYIASYSPYENVGAKPYPPVMATTAVGDDRVGYWEPAKWIAALRARSTSGRPMLLHTEMAGGHHGAAGRFDELAQAARMYAFAIRALDRS
ncbi:S9 family peptidase [Nostoc sp. 3335mG]|nr:S9 family peptidase [Nostoc sp. 3335mG]